MENICQTKTCGIQSIVVGCPDVQTQYQNCHVEQIQTDHNLEDIISTDKNIGDGSEEEHQGVSDKKCYDRCDRSRLRIFRKSGKVRGCSSTGYEGSHNQTSTADNGKGTAGYGKLIHDGSVALADRHDHGYRTEHCYQWHCDITDDSQGIDTEVSGSCHTHAGYNNQCPHGGLTVPKQFSCYRNREHRDTYTKPADLCKTDHC